MQLPVVSNQTVPLPSHIHYELLLKLLEQKSLPSLQPGTTNYIKVQQIIIQLRKAVAIQKTLELECNRLGWGVEYYWSLNHLEQPES